MARRILLLITDLEIGGTPTVMRELATRLNDPPGVVVEVACLKRWGPVADQLRDAGVTVTAFGASRAWKLPEVVRMLRRLARDHQIDTVFSFLIHANAVAAAAARRLPGVRFLQSIQTIQPRPRWHWWLQRGIQAAAERIVVPSSAVARAAREICGVPGERIAVIPNAVDPGDYRPVPVFTGPRIRVGFLGRLDPVKRLQDFVEGIRRCAAKDQGVEGHIFGAGPERGWIDALIARGALRGLTVHGEVNRPQDALGQMDVLFLPSRAEGFGLVLIEAMASGVPVIARPAGGVTDVVRHEANGLLIGRDFFDPEEFCSAVKRLRDDAAFRDRLIDAGLATVKERFCWDAVLPKYRELLLQS